MQNSVLIVAAHPDDEVLGCGGMIAKHADNGDNVHVVITAEGHTSRNNLGESDKNMVSYLRTCAEKANRALGAQSVNFLGLPDNRLDQLDRLDLIKKVELVVQKTSPKIIYTHHLGDLNVDHRRIHEAVMTACRPMPGSTVEKIFSFEVMSSTEWQTPNASYAFTPNWYEDISNQWERKLAALHIYESEMRDWPHSRSIKSLKLLAELRGTQVGLTKLRLFVY